ncbi:MAG: glycine cleavage system protein H, partial [Chloroflexi bacterium]|nr:glycine cleavage system protein H [Chloroflexota bacterium]
MAKWKTPENYKYSESDEWYHVDGETVTMGITDYAQDQLSDIVYVELPEVGASLNAGDSLGVVESVKAASDVYSIVGGE